MSDARGVGDRWLAGEAVEGVEIPPRATVIAIAGRHEGKNGVVALLMAVTPHPVYLVEIDGGGVARLRQDEMRPL